MTDAEAIVRLRHIVDEASAIALETLHTSLVARLRVIVLVCGNSIAELEAGEQFQQESGL